MIYGNARRALRILGVIGRISDFRATGVTGPAIERRQERRHNEMHRSPHGLFVVFVILLVFTVGRCIGHTRCRGNEVSLDERSYDCAAMPRSTFIRGSSRFLMAYHYIAHEIVGILLPA